MTRLLKIIRFPLEVWGPKYGGLKITVFWLGWLFVAAALVWWTTQARP